MLYSLNVKYCDFMWWSNFHYGDNESQQQQQELPTIAGSYCLISHTRLAQNDGVVGDYLSNYSQVSIMNVMTTGTS